MTWFSPPTVESGVAVAQQIPLRPTPSQFRMMTAEDTIVAVCSSTGEGKTYGCIMSVIYHAHRGGVPLKAAIIRDTHENIKHSVVDSFNNFFDDTKVPHQWSNDFKNLQIQSTQPIKIDLMGVGDLPSITRIQGPEYGLVWLEEPCPYTVSSEANAGLSEDLYNAALLRCARQRDNKAKLLLSFNPPDDDHWVTRRILNAPDGMVSPKTPLITKLTIRIERGENQYLKEEARQAAIAAYMHDPVGYARFVEGQVATKYAGKAVTGRAFNKDWHVAPMPLSPVEGMPGWIGWDSWGNPAAVLGQQFPDGRLWVLDVLVDANDIRDLVRNFVNPLVQSPRWKGKCASWRQIGDRTMRQPDQSNHSENAADVVEKEFDPLDGVEIPFEPGPQTWPHVYNGIMHALRDTAAGGQPKVLIDPARCRPLIAAFNGRWHFRTNAAGVVTQLTPQKDAASHCADAASNAICVLAPWTSMNQSQYMKRRHMPGHRRRAKVAQSYVSRTPVVV